MITDSMNASDLYRIRKADDGRLKVFQRNKEGELYRSLRRNKVNSIITAYDYKTSNADYKVTFYIRGKQVSVSGIFGFVKERNAYIAMTSVQKAEDYYMAFSIHLIKRYAERYLKKNISVPKALSHFVYDHTGSMLIYWDGNNRLVYAINGGIMLGIADPNKHIVYMNTFVSLDMLKDSQVKSYDKIRLFVEEAKKRLAYARGSGNLAQCDVACGLIYKDMAELDLEEAKEIYATFFER